MSRYLYVCLLICSPAWGNLVINASFETYSACPNNFGEITYAIGWSSPNSASPDYLNSCAGNNVFGTPVNNWGTQTPASGAAYTFGRVWGNVPPNTTEDYREYVQGTLSQPLVEGLIYQVDFLVSLAEDFTPIVEMGAYFSPTPFNINSNTVLNVTPQIVHGGGLLSDTVNWMSVSGSFTAAGGESYIIIGNFLNDATTTAASRDGLRISAYFIDDVSVTNAVPEPATLVLLGPGIAGLALRRHKQ